MPSPKIQKWSFQKLIHHESVCGFIFSSPFIIGFLLFTILPMLYSLYISFTDFKITAAPLWIGLTNYIRMFTGDPQFLKSIAVTLYFVLVSVPLKLAFALIVAYLLTRKNRLDGFYRSVYYLPSLIGGSVAVTLVWKELFATKGVVNNFLSLFGLKTVFWLGDPAYAMWVLVLLTVWQFGSSMIIFAAGLKQIPVTYYESAQIDGASQLQQFFRITLPCLSPVILFNLVMQTISGFMNFTQAFIISKGTGGPMDSTLFYALYLYKRAFNYFEMGYASAMAWILLIMIAIVTALIFKTSDQWVFYESKEEK
ncbi:carbohydrate ABC transporter permease [Hydrogenispora ethanolica]|uniref:carbohydrate ABC transporter permease n=1 Tax=Hydrogenispora ethanolica TaxID=1082276 RepID=UPI0010521FAB|nr:sugar ABC transporter permease [Hydrogenispora ethanolica]